MYAQLAVWHAMYGGKVEMLLYPSDEFGGQELPSDQIANFVHSKGLPTMGGGCTLMQKAKAASASEGDAIVNAAHLYVRASSKCAKVATRL